MAHGLLAETTDLTKTRIGATIRDAASVLTAPTAEQLAAIAGHDLTPP
ncbi:hypothetical protein [Streptomyces flaveolus]